VKAVEPAPAPSEPKPAVEPPVVLKAVEKAAPVRPVQPSEDREDARAAQPKPRAKAEAATAQNKVFAVPSFAGQGTPASAAPSAPVFGGKKLWALFGGLAMLGLAGGTLYYLQSHATAKSAVSARDAASFQLKAERSGGQLLVSWNRQSGAIKAAQGAVLSISDGAKTEDVSLDLAQLHAGSIMYSPLSGDVSFRLEVNDGKAGKIRSEFVRAPIDAVTDPAPKDSSNDAAKSSSQQAQLTPPQQQQALQKPVTPEAARIDTNAPANATDEAAPTPKPAAEPPKPFSLAARIRQPEPSELPEAPSVGASASSLAVRPGTLSRLPAPPPPPPQVQPTQSAPATRPPATPSRTRDTVQEPKLLRRVDAAYPPMARQARVGGVVRIQATIGADGKVKKIEVRSGPPLLRQAAIDAVQKWVYSPSLLNGSPIEAKADVDVNFNLNSH
jgi:TonB family protein